MWSLGAGKKTIKIKKNQKITAFDLHISPLCRVGHAGPIFTLFGTWGHMADVITLSNFKSIGQGVRGLRLPKIGFSHWLWMSLLKQCYARTCYTVIHSQLVSVCTILFLSQEVQYCNVVSVQMRSTVSKVISCIMHRPRSPSHTFQQYITLNITGHSCSMCKSTRLPDLYPAFSV